ncbi:MAG: hypothetical protein KBA31_04475 [Alphaproteobacteria bacterium]|nr:hypothetical protein [Alphaproteobacteria bacterium]
MRLILLIAATLVGVASTVAELNAAPAAPEPIAIAGYGGEAMEPFVSRDGRVLFFNTRNDPGADTNIHFATTTGTGFTYRGMLSGTVSNDLDAVPTMSAGGRFCFISPRAYRATLVSVFCGAFDGTKVAKVEPQRGLAAARLGRLIFDVELSTDGNTMLFAEGTFSGGAVPDEADIYIATLTPKGFRRSPESARILAAVNTGALEFAPALAADGRELWFTRITGIWPFKSPTIFRATRTSIDQPFGKPEHVDAIEGFVEAPTFAPNGAIYFHKRSDDRYQLWRLTR